MNQEWALVQVEQASETFRFLVGAVLSAWAITLGADAALIVFGATSRSLIALLLAAVLPLVAAATWLAITRSLLALAYIGMRAELVLGDGIVGIYGRLIVPRRTERIRKMVEMKPEHAEAALRRFVIAPIGITVVSAFIGVSGVQFVLAFLLTS